MNWEQLKTILWLRRQLTRNQWARGGSLGRIISILAVVFGSMAALGAFGIGVGVGATVLAKVEPKVVMMVWFGVTIGFLFMWAIGLLTELQRSETIDLQKLMHLPVRLGQLFVINFIASHVVFSVIVCVPAMLGLALGLAVARGPAMLLLIPFSLAMVLMVSAWTYCLRGWLATLMANPRKRRSVIMGITFAFVLVFQLPNLLGLFNGAETRGERRQQRTQHTLGALRTLNSFQVYIPPLWLPVGARALAEGRAAPALAGIAGCLVLGALGLRRAYRTTVRFYHGDSTARPATTAPTANPQSALAVSSARHATFLERGIPGAPGEASAVATATLQSMLRAPEVKMMWATSALVALVVGGGVFLRSSAQIPDVGKPFIATGMITFAIFMLFQFLSNLFGYDREGFRALVLSPVDRRHILLGKNLATAPVAAVSALVFLGIAAWGMKLGPLLIAAALLQLIALFALASIIGNVISILVPFRMQSGTMKATKMPPLAVLMLIAFQLLAPVSFAPVFIPPTADLIWHKLGLSPAVPVNLIFSAALAGLALLAYALTLAPLGRLLTRREIKILNTVSSPVE